VDDQGSRRKNGAVREKEKKEKNALRQAEAVPDLGVAWFIPTFFVPLLLVTHYQIFVRLLQQPAPVLRTEQDS
jgi:hypothetical protein